MTRDQWNVLRRCAAGETVRPVPVALIIDSPWIPGYVGCSTLDYLSMPDVWLAANLQVAREFPDLIGLPGFWVEFGMAAEPSGFGGKVTYFTDKPPAVHPQVRSIEEAVSLPLPDPTADGLMPVILNYYQRAEPRVNDAGHVIKMVAARGPLTLATHLMGVSEFLLAMKLDPQRTHEFLKLTTALTRTWLAAQAEVLHEVEGILVLDDIAGFMSPKDYREFAHPCLEAVFAAFPGVVKMFHNDTDNPTGYPFLRELGIHIFNFTHLQPLAKVRQLVGPDLCLLGNVPPLDVLAQGTPEAVTAAAQACLATHAEGKGLILSAGGGASPGTPAANVHALLRAARAPHPLP